MTTTMFTQISVQDLSHIDVKSTNKSVKQILKIHKVLPEVLVEFHFIDIALVASDLRI